MKLQPLQHPWRGWRRRMERAGRGGRRLPQRWRGGGGAGCGGAAS
uniref:Uncharacterized protein n=1 Tax=Arundo donax TaxID=35708 RepID=A0A0A9F1G4_ARUDO